MIGSDPLGGVQRFPRDSHEIENTVILGEIKGVVTERSRVFFCF